VSQENVDVVMALWAGAGPDIAALYKDDHTFAQMTERLSQVLAEDFESAMVFPGYPVQTRFGVEAFLKNWRDWLEPWATYRTTIDEAIDLGDQVVLLFRAYGRREGTDAEVELLGAQICTVRDGKVARWEDWGDRDEAMKSLGLSEWPAAER
jgi:ketosteroid isomerase-like protein